QPAAGRRARIGDDRVSVDLDGRLSLSDRARRRHRARYDGGVPSWRRPCDRRGAVRALHRRRPRGVRSRSRPPDPGGTSMTNEEWFEGVTSELVARSPFRRSEYFKRFASGALPRSQAWIHLSQHYLLIAWFPRIFSGIHARCDDLDVRKDCARHRLVEDLGYFGGRVGGTPITTSSIVGSATISGTRAVSTRRSRRFPRWRRSSTTSRRWPTSC